MSSEDGGFTVASKPLAEFLHFSRTCGEDFAPASGGVELRVPLDPFPRGVELVGKLKPDGFGRAGGLLPLERFGTGPGLEGPEPEFGRGIVGACVGSCVIKIRVSRLVNAELRELGLCPLREQLKSVLVVLHFCARGVCLECQLLLDRFKTLGSEELLQKIQPVGRLGTQESREVSLREHDHPGELFPIHPQDISDFHAGFVVAGGLFFPRAINPFTQEGFGLLGGEALASTGTWPVPRR
ncbi:hypothetical protein AHiyo1_52850 [Arthrobacter sp. Hiyo1]|uniref:hypothetical protein n=1 Tax=Arthrobacter sp. Hiyo1 TaxID=1588020 RepID=UPI0006A32C97|nr:hypothetical protein [Arthrobacter sp. Hiyo1]GAP61571.1 hypothetical protein AHiyo1_52850 [Arthrobacter sp. Hiyo1]